MAKETSENRFTFGHSSFCILLRKKNWISRRVFFFSRSLSIPSVGLSLSNYLSLNLPLVHSVIHSCSLCHTLLFTLSYKTYSGVFVCVFRFFYPHFFKLFFFVDDLLLEQKVKRKCKNVILTQFEPEIHTARRIHFGITSFEEDDMLLT